MEQTCALWGPIPRLGADGRRSALFDRLFNLPSLRPRGRRAAQGRPIAVRAPVVAHERGRRDRQHPAPAARRARRHRRAARRAHRRAGRRRSVPTRPRPNEADRGFALTAANLTLLYRHARLAELLALAWPTCPRCRGPGCRAGTSRAGRPEGPARRLRLVARPAGTPWTISPWSLAAPSAGRGLPGPGARRRRDRRPGRRRPGPGVRRHSVRVRAGRDRGATRGRRSRPTRASIERLPDDTVLPPCHRLRPGDRPGRTGRRGHPEPELRAVLTALPRQHGAAARLAAPLGSRSRRWPNWSRSRPRSPGAAGLVACTAGRTDAPAGGLVAPGPAQRDVPVKGRSTPPRSPSSDTIMTSSASQTLATLDIPVVRRADRLRPSSPGRRRDRVTPTALH